MYCAECDKTMSTVDIMNIALERWRDTVIPNERAQHNRPDTNIPLTPARLDMAAYTFSYHMNGGCALEKEMYKLEMHHRCSTAHYIQVNQHKKKTAKNNYELDVL